MRVGERMRKIDYSALMEKELESVRLSGRRPKLLLHLCCAPCSAYVIRLLNRQFNLLLYFYDPNIHPREEYERRRDEATRFASSEGITFEEGPYDVERWFDRMQGLEEEPEKGGRCGECYDMRMGEAARYARERNFEYFTTVLSLSPHKDAERINAAGLKFEREYGIKYLPADFKKKEGFKRSVEIGKEKGFYRQDYCGCSFSMR